MTLKLKRQIILLASAIGIMFYVAWQLTVKTGIDPDTWQHIEADRSTNYQQVESRQLQYLVIFQQAGMVMGFMLIPLGLTLYRNHATLKRHRRSLTRAFQTSASNVERNLGERLLLKYPHLTHYDLGLCKILADGLSSKEIAASLNISPASVNTARYRLRKKLHLQENVDLIKFLNQFKR